MTQVVGNEIIHKYLRHNKKFPHVLCPGCGHGIFLGSFIRSIHELGIPKDDVVVVAGIGCSGRLAVYVDFNTVHTTHGRALTFATGIKMSNPKLNVICIVGDGDAMSIGGNHLIHAARKNIGLTTFVLNNNIYGMTGGQCSPTTPDGAFSMTSPYGQMESSFDIVKMAEASGANYVARGTTFHVKKLQNMMTDAIVHDGFSLVEIMTPCHTQFGRKNKFRSPVQMYEHLKKSVKPIDKYNSLSEEEREGLTPMGVFVDNKALGLEQRYYALKDKLGGKE